MTATATRPAARKASPRPAPRPSGGRERARRDRREPPDPTPSWWSVRALTVVAFVMIFGCLLGLAVFHSILVQNQAGLDRLAQDVAFEEQRAGGLRLRFANSESDARIVANARAVDMVLPRERKALPAVLPGAGNTPVPAAHPFGIPPATPPTTAAPSTTAPPPTTPPPTAPPTAVAPSTAPGPVPAATVPPASRPPAPATSPNPATATTRPPAPPTSAAPAPATPAPATTVVRSTNR